MPASRPLGMVIDGDGGATKQPDRLPGQMLRMLVPEHPRRPQSGIFQLFTVTPVWLTII
jgi:hypothetical protein